MAETEPGFSETFGFRHVLPGFGFVCPWSKWFLSWFQEKTDKGEKSLKIQKKAQKNARIPIKNAGFAYKNHENKGFVCGFGFVRICPDSFGLVRPLFALFWASLVSTRQNTHMSHRYMT